MALFKRVSGKPETESIFPQPLKAESVQKDASESVIASEAVAALLAENPVFIDQVSEAVAQRVLAALCNQYDFTPTDKYLEEVSNRRKYIGQLDSYLQQRQEINNTVENELQVFLQETTASLAKALDTFTVSIQKRIKQAEARHGIDSIKKSLLSIGNEGSINKL
jgi:hypothetical protein